MLTPDNHIRRRQILAHQAAAASRVVGEGGKSPDKRPRFASASWDLNHLHGVLDLGYRIKADNRNTMPSGSESSRQLRVIEMAASTPAEQTGKNANVKWHNSILPSCTVDRKSVV